MYILSIKLRDLKSVTPTKIMINSYCTITFLGSQKRIVMINCYQLSLFLRKTSFKNVLSFDFLFEILSYKASR